MNIDFHYYATYCAAYIAGYSHRESLKIAYASQLTDLCSKTFLKRIGGPASAATTMLQLELLDARTDLVGLQEITRIWASFHFLPGDLYAQKKGCGRTYLNKYRLICNPNGALLLDTVTQVKGRGLEAAGLAMHILADTWAHRYFAGTPSLVINNTNNYFFEIFPEIGPKEKRKIEFNHNPQTPDDPERSYYTNSVFQGKENSVMNLGHGRAGHMPDYSFIRYRYLPGWDDYEEIIKDNPHDYMRAFCQMVDALRYLRGDLDTFETDRYDIVAVRPYMDRINEILRKRQLDSCADWKALGEKISGETIEDFDLEKYIPEYRGAAKDEKDDTVIGRFILAALAQKSMVTNRIFRSGNLLAGFSIDFGDKGFSGMRDYMSLVKRSGKEAGK
jgi:hypothetical protein